jgi:hypothetical protein
MRMRELMVLAVALGACGGDGGNGPNQQPKASLAGSWAGTTLISGVDFSISAVMTDQSGSIHGSGTIDADNGALNCPATIAGSRSGNDFSISFSCSGFQAMNYAGEVTGGDNMTGLINGSGFDDLPFTMEKQ